MARRILRRALRSVASILHGVAVAIFGALLGLVVLPLLGIAWARGRLVYQPATEAEAEADDTVSRTARRMRNPATWN